MWPSSLERATISLILAPEAIAVKNIDFCVKSLSKAESLSIDDANCRTFSNDQDISLGGALGFSLALAFGILLNRSLLRSIPKAYLIGLVRANLYDVSVFAERPLL